MSKGYALGVLWKIQRENGFDPDRARGVKEIDLDLQVQFESFFPRPKWFSSLGIEDSTHRTLNLENHMSTIEQKKSEVDAFLSEKARMKRIELEKVISGSTQFRDYIAPLISVAGWIGFLILVVTTGRLNLPALYIFSLGLWFRIEWSRFQERARNKQILALKEYFDLRLEDNNGGTK